MSQIGLSKVDQIAWKDIELESDVVNVVDTWQMDFRCLYYTPINGNDNFD